MAASKQTQRRGRALPAWPVRTHEPFPFGLRAVLSLGVAALFCLASLPGHGAENPERAEKRAEKSVEQAVPRELVRDGSASGKQALHPPPPAREGPRTTEIPATVPPARALAIPAALGPGRVDPAWGFQFGWGLHHLTVEAPGLNEEFQPRSFTKDGTSLTLDFVLGGFRLGYIRQYFRREPARGILFEGAWVTLVGFESDQFWAYHGFRPWRLLYLGYGLGWQRREISVKRETVLASGATVSAPTIGITESVAMGGLMLDWAFALPFSLQVRTVREEGGAGRFLRVSGETLILAYVAPF